MNEVLDKFKNEKLYFSFLIVTAMLFAEWTLAVHLSMIFNINWNNLIKIYLISIIPSIYIFYKLVNLVYVEFSKQTNNNKNYKINFTKYWVIIPAFIVLYFYINNYKLQIFYVLILIILFKIFKVDVQLKTLEANNEVLFSSKEFIGFLSIILIPVIINIFTHRSDYDDVEYLQLAMQSNLHPELVPNTFDTSLGYLVNKFRFIPYKFVSYELMVGMVSKVTTINIYYVYYYLIPVVCSILSTLSLYFLIRWFVTKEIAIFALFLCVLFFVSWGDTHTSYGNRIYVRLFQGKANIVSIITPLTFLVGLILLNSRKISVLILLSAVGIMSIGFSTNGIIISVVLGLMLGIIALINSKNLLRNSWYIFLATLYPLIIAIYIKVGGQQATKLSEIGSVLPISTSFGNMTRQTLMLLVVALALLIFSRGLRFTKLTDTLTHKLHWLAIIILVVFLIPLNPFFTEYFASKSSANMAWRLAWAAPIPLLLGLTLSIFISPILKQRYFNNFIVFTCIVLFGFLIADKWTIANSNRANWAWSSNKLPEEYYQTKDLIDYLKKDDKQITLLIDPHLAAWLPIIDPQIKTIMLGHNFKNGLANLLSKEDFLNRELLVNNVYKNNEATSFPIDLINYYKINYIIFDKNNDNYKNFINKNIEVKEYKNYYIYKLN